MAVDADAVLLGLGTFEVGSYPLPSPTDYVDVGYIKGTTVRYSRELKEFESAGLLVKRLPFRESFGIDGEWAQVSIENLAFVIQGTSTSTLLEFGGDTTITRRSIKFTHTRDDGKELTVTVHKTVAGAEFELAFAEEDFIQYPVSFNAELDSTKAVGKQYGSIELVTP